MTPWLEHLLELVNKKIDYVQVTLVNVRGSAPQEIGAKMLVNKEGLLFGTIGGGKIEAHCIRSAQNMLESISSSMLVTYNLQTDIGMTCGGEVSLFFETHYFKQWTVAVFGAGHVAQELCRVMQTWSCQVKIFDPRKEWIDKIPNLSHFEKVITENSADHVAGLPKGTYLLSLTQGHSSDVPVLEVALKNHNHFSFLGVIGSSVKADKIKAELRKRNVIESALEHLHCPVGLELGDNSPPEIAISIAAQILLFKSNKKKEIK